MRALTLTNDFHNTVAVVHPRVVEVTRSGKRILGLTHRQVLRAEQKLCGMHGCACGGCAGERGRYYVECTPDEWTVTLNHYVLHDGDIHWSSGLDDRLQEAGA